MATYYGVMWAGNTYFPDIPDTPMLIIQVKNRLPALYV